MVRGVLFCLLVLLYTLTFLSDSNAYPRSDFLENGDGFEQEIEDPLQPFDWLDEENDNFKSQREEVLQKMQEIFGIHSQSDNLAHRKVPPQFMMELYNTIADPNGVTRGRNLYNAKVVRSFVEKDHFFNITSSLFYYFNVSRLEINESVLEAELHLYRKKTPSKNLASPYYLIRVYQVLNDRSFDMPDLHRLLNVCYVSAHVSGWQVFNVKQAVLGWVSGEPNLGLLVTVQDLFEDEVSVEFSRRNEYYLGKQPILVLFNDDRNLAVDYIAPHYYVYENRNDEENAEKNAKSEKIDLKNKYDNVEYHRKYKKHHKDGQLERIKLVNRRKPEFFERQKKILTEENDDLQELHETSIFGTVTKRRRGHRDVTSSRKRFAKIVSHDDAKITQVLTSMDIYERAAFRERLGLIVRDRSLKRSIAQKQRYRLPRSVGSHNIIGARQAEMNKTNDCTRHELYVNFRNIGLSSSIIAPPGYSAYQCKGVCEPPLSQDQRPTNHATIQAIVHKLGLVEGVQRPCCVPTKLLRTSILFYDNNENVVLKMYDDMIVDSCGCR
ncbi:uncharacterized protein LOC109862894 [Pseudomyrmex gracilis]|uniref:uncharacterized protein LOC109862894 n=1 Tax=Pseudomyrmex gracilis TaxID=219809 RepID=UPI0009953FD2|nr:uncharacterized protein LOC109862894 [Pseudomyrmex gracilis]XP_020298650.1 uncharacterized protein LOC109862894 [Pseudomyrmex gracilis]